MRTTPATPQPLVCSVPSRVPPTTPAVSRPLYVPGVFLPRSLRTCCGILCLGHASLQLWHSWPGHAFQVSAPTSPSGKPALSAWALFALCLTLSTPTCLRFPAILVPWWRVSLTGSVAHVPCSVHLSTVCLPFRGLLSEPDLAGWVSAGLAHSRCSDNMNMNE